MRSGTHGLINARQHFFFFNITIIQLLAVTQYYIIPIRMYDIFVSNNVVNKTRSLSIIIITILCTRKLFI